MDKLLNLAELSFLKCKLEIILASMFVGKVCSRSPKTGKMLNKPDTRWVLEIWELLLTLCRKSGKKASKEGDSEVGER